MLDAWTPTERNSSAAVMPDSDAGSSGDSAMPGSGVRRGR